MSAQSTIRLLIACAIAAAGVALGQTRVRIEGLTRKSEAKALELLGDRLEHVRKKNASPSRADDAAFLLREVLRADGYSDVEVDWRIVTPEEIVLMVREGKRLGLGTIQIDGALDAEQARRMSRLVSRQADRDRPLGLGDPPFREADIEAGLAAIIQDLRANGFWAASAVLSDRREDGGLVHLTIRVHAGPLHTIGTAVIQTSDREMLQIAESKSASFVGRPSTACTWG